MMIRRWTGLGEDGVFDLRFSAGERYLQQQLNGDKMAFNRLVNSVFFWNWWNGQWNIRDEWFVALNRGQVGKTDWLQAEQVVMAEKYKGFHLLELGQPHLAHGLTHIKVKFAGFGEQPTNMAVLQMVCWECNVAKTMLLGRSRKQDVVFARHLAAKLLRESGNSLKQVAMVLRRKNHTTIINSEKQADALLETDKDFLTKYNKIKSTLWVEVIESVRK